ncbi:MAG: lysophospholipase, partial [Cyanobacteria bacterium]|nr:lysophospholipase [Cyanobacteriota bacterium]
FVFLFSHGNSGNISIRDKMARLMLLTGASVFVYDYQGFGRSTGIPSIEGICSDARGAYDYLVQNGTSQDSIIAYGESLGAAVSSYLTTVRRVRSLVLQSGFASLQRIAHETFPLLRLYPEFLFPKPTLDSQSVLSRNHPPVLLIHGELDSVVPLQHSIDMFNASIGQKTLLKLPHAAHSDISQTSADLYLDALKTFLS